MESLGGREKRFMETEKDYRDFLNTCDPERVISLTHPVFGSVNTPLSGLIQHVVNHGTYHLKHRKTIVRLTALLRRRFTFGKKSTLRLNIAISLNRLVLTMFVKIVIIIFMY
jgi:hypothetical protein